MEDYEPNDIPAYTCPLCDYEDDQVVFDQFCPACGADLDFEDDLSE